MPSCDASKAERAAKIKAEKTAWENELNDWTHERDPCSLDVIEIMCTRELGATCSAATPCPSRCASSTSTRTTSEPVGILSADPMRAGVLTVNAGGIGQHAAPVAGLAGDSPKPDQPHTYTG
jgi:hypothetical protein